MYIDLIATSPKFQTGSKINDEFCGKKNINFRNFEIEVGTQKIIIQLFFIKK